ATDAGSRQPRGHVASLVRADLEAAINAKSPPGVTVTVSGGQLVVEANVVNPTHPAEQSSVHFMDASTNSATARLGLGVANGGVEVDGSADQRPAQTGSVSPGGVSAAATGQVTVEVLKAGTSVKSGIPLQLWDNAL